jgi:hypothetical protein
LAQGRFSLVPAAAAPCPVTWLPLLAGACGCCCCSSRAPPGRCRAGFRVGFHWCRRCARALSEKCPSPPPPQDARRRWRRRWRVLRRCPCPQRCRRHCPRSCCRVPRLAASSPIASLNFPGRAPTRRPTASLALLLLDDGVAEGGVAGSAGGVACDMAEPSPLGPTLGLPGMLPRLRSPRRRRLARGDGDREEVRGLRSPLARRDVDEALDLA